MNEKETKETGSEAKVSRGEKGGEKRGRSRSHLTARRSVSIYGQYRANIRMDRKDSLSVLRTMSYKIIITLAFMALFVSIGCSDRITRETLVGSYRLEYPYGQEELKLGKDGKYTQFFTLKNDDKQIRHEGSWEYNQADSEVILNDPLIIDNGFGRLSPSFSKVQSGNGFFYVHRSWSGKIRLRVNEDQGFFYEKWD